MEATRVRHGVQRERGVGRGRRRGQRPVRRRVSDDIRATLVDHVINHGLSMREAGQRVHPNLSRYIVVTVCVFSNTFLYILLHRVVYFDAAALPHEFIYVDEAGFNLAKTRRRVVM